MRSCIALTLAVLLLAPPAMAQIYKCPDASGRTVIQQMPCAGGAKVKTPATEPSRASSSDARAKAAALCESALRSAPVWKDAASLRISNVVRIGFDTVALHGTSLVAVKYGAMVNGKNSYGAYAGEKPAFCYLDPTETRVLDVQTF